MFGSSPDDPGPLATNLSPAIKPAPVAAAMRKVADWQLAQIATVLRRRRSLPPARWSHLDLGRALQRLRCSL
jgi:hypothetical protein